MWDSLKKTGITLIATNLERLILTISLWWGKNDNLYSILLYDDKLYHRVCISSQLNCALDFMNSLSCGVRIKRFYFILLNHGVVYVYWRQSWTMPDWFGKKQSLIEKQQVHWLSWKADIAALRDSGAFSVNQEHQTNNLDHIFMT